MADKKASEAELAALHATVAKVLIKRLTVGTLTKDGEEVPDSEGLGCGAADISAAIAFLKNNNITADPETNKGLHELKDRLDKMRKAGKEGLRGALADAEISVDRDLGLLN